MKIQVLIIYHTVYCTVMQSFSWTINHYRRGGEHR